MQASPSARHNTIIAVDDDDINLSILAKTAKDAGYKVKPFSSGETTWNYLTQHASEIDIALIDKMMPGMSGMELLKRMKQDQTLKNIPVILQTGDAGTEQMREGLEKGAYYYLTKPFLPEILVALLGSVQNECKLREELRTQAAIDKGKLMSLQREAEYHFRTHSEARILAAAIAQATAKPDLIARGLMELFFNAIEHGNLDIGYEKKRERLISKCWRNELAMRLRREDCRHRFVQVKTKRIMSNMHIQVIDQGKGFNWQQFLRVDFPFQLNEPNGRGIAIAMRVLNELHYNAKGNEATCNVSLVYS